MPGQVSVTGYDDSLLARLALVALTTVSQNAQEQAARAVALATGRLETGRVTPREEVLIPELILRRTTGPPGSS